MRGQHGPGARSHAARGGGARRLRRTTILTAAGLAVLGGLGLARITPFFPGWAVLPLGLFGLISLRSGRALSLYACVAFGLAFGLWRGGIYMQRLGLYDQIGKQKVVAVATATTDATYGVASQITFDANNIHVVEPYAQPLVGTLEISGFGARMVYKGDVVQVSGKLYRTRGSHTASIHFADVQVVKRSHFWLDGLRRRFAAGMLNDLPEPLGSFGMGLLVGAKSGIDTTTSDTLKAVGLTHIIAVSGYNLTIIIMAMRRLFGKQSKYQVFIFSVLLVIGFLLITGLSASIVRASLVCCLSLLAAYYGRSIKPVLLLTLAAAITAMWNPLYLWSDIGWWLSFLAFFGIVVMGPAIESKIAKRRKVGPITGVLVESSAAQLATLPFILFIFGVSSWMALPANMLVVPFIPLAMLLSFIAGLAGMIIPAIAGWIAWPAQMVLTYLLDMAGLLQRVPHMQITTQLTLWQMLAFYAVICFVIGMIWRKSRRAAIITEVETRF